MSNYNRVTYFYGAVSEHGPGEQQQQRAGRAAAAVAIKECH